MNPHLDDDAQTFGVVARRAFSSAGGVDLARRAEADPSVRSTEITPLLDRLGIADIDARVDQASAEAAAALCREAGRVVLPYPIVASVLDRLALCNVVTSSAMIDRGAEPIGERPSKHSTMIRGAAAPLSDDGATYPRTSLPMIDHGDLFDEWRLAELDATAVRGASERTRLGTRLGPFVGPVANGEPVEVTTTEVALHLTLTGFLIAGALTAALELATAHVTERVQFDKPLSSFQAVQFQLADAHVLVASVDEVTQFALWRCHVAAEAAPEAAITDALAARLAALDAARTVLRITQQLHGAAGVCDEYDVSVIARHLQPALRLPFGAEATAEHLAQSIEEHGFVGLFDHGGVRA